MLSSVNQCSVVKALWSPLTEAPPPSAGDTQAGLNWSGAKACKIDTKIFFFGVPKLAIVVSQPFVKFL